MQVKQQRTYEAPAKVAAGEPCAWANPFWLPFEATRGVCELVVSDEDIADAAARLQHFAPFFERVFPETRATAGLIESPLRPIPAMQRALGQAGGNEVRGRLFLKMDSHLAVAGSVKARGGIYEVLKFAEGIALDAGLITADGDYARLADPDALALRPLHRAGGLHGQPGDVYRPHGRGAGPARRGAHVGRRQAVEEGPAARQGRGGA